MTQKQKEQSVEELVKQHVRDIPDFPKPGIMFKDITPLLSDPSVFRSIIEVFAQRYKGEKLSAIVGIESRGFLFGAALAHSLGIAFVPIRKKGKLPYETIEVSYDLEYGSAVVEMHTDALRNGDKVVIIDDLLATGGTAAAACELVRKSGGAIHECAFVIELAFLDGRKHIADAASYAIASYS